MANPFAQADSNLIAPRERKEKPVLEKASDYLQEENPEEEKPQKRAKKPSRELSDVQAISDTPNAQKPAKGSSGGNMSPDDILSSKLKKKKSAGTYGFYLDDDVVAALERLAKNNHTNVSKALNTILRAYLLNE